MINLSEIYKENSMQYFLDINSLYERINEDIKDFKNLENIISEIEKNIRIKRLVFCKKNQPIVYIIFIFLFAILFSPLYFKSILFFPLSLFISVLLCFLFILLYKKKILVKWENNYKKTIKPYYEKIIEIIEDLQVCNIQYEDISLYLSDDSKHPIAIYIMYESLCNDHTTSIEDALDFYQKRYNILKNKIDDVSQQLCTEIKNSETSHKKIENELACIKEKEKKYNN